MKYMVMECSKGRAVLMDEEGRFVFAANLGYEVGQCVTNPILAETTSNKSSRIIVLRIAAAAACLALFAAPCYSYYARNLKTCSAVTISSHAEISMELNRDGKVIRLQSNTDYGRELIETHEIKGKDKLEAVNEILQSEISDGYLADGDTVDVYIDSKNDEEYHSYKTEFEAELPKLDIKVEVHGKGHLKDKHTPQEDKKEQDKVKPEKPAAPTPPKPTVDKPAAPAEPAPAPEDLPVPPDPGDKPVHEHPVHPQTPVQPQAGEPATPEKPNKNEQIPPHLYDREDEELPPQPEQPPVPTEEEPHFRQRPNREHGKHEGLSNTEEIAQLPVQSGNPESEQAMP